MNTEAPDVARGMVFAGLCAISAAITWWSIGRRQSRDEDDREPRSVSNAILILSAALLGVAIQVREGLFSPWAVTLLGFACAGTIAATCARQTLARVPIRDVFFGLTTFLFFGLMGLIPPAGWMTLGFERWSPFAILLAIASLAGGAIVGLRRVSIAVFLPIMLALHGGIGAWVIHHSPLPAIDVFVFQRDSADALLAGKNPYAMTFPNIYGKHAWVYAEDVQADGRLLFGYPYMPFTLLLTTPAHRVFGDVRYAHLAALTLSAALIVLARPGRTSLLAATLLLFSPRSFYILDQSWIEPFVVMMLAATVFCAARCRRALPYVLGAFLVSKQYMLAGVLVAPLLVPREKWKEARTWIDLGWRAALAAIAITMPFVLWNVGAFWNSVLVLQIKQPFRYDSLSFLAVLSDVRYKYGGLPIVTPPPFAFVIPFIALLLGAALSHWKLKPSPRAFTLAIALTFLLFFAFNKQAFANYYFLVLAALLTAIAAPPGIGSDPVGARRISGLKPAASNVR